MHNVQYNVLDFQVRYKRRSCKDQQQHQQRWRGQQQQHHCTQVQHVSVQRDAYRVLIKCTHIHGLNKSVNKITQHRTVLHNAAEQSRAHKKGERTKPTLFCIIIISMHVLSICVCSISCAIGLYIPTVEIETRVTMCVCVSVCMDGDSVKRSKMASWREPSTMSENVHDVYSKQAS